MKFLKNIIKKSGIMQRLIGLTTEQLTLLEKNLAPLWEASEKKRKNSYDRKRKIGAGHPYKFESLQQIIVLVFLYYKQYLTQEFLGIMVDLDQANISRILKKILPLIEKAADPELANYLNKIQEEHADAEKTNNFADFLQKNPDLKDVSHDATEQQCYRSKNYEKQKKYYSGKKKKHTLKTQISVASTGRIVDVSKTHPGSVHDKKIIDEEGTISKFPDKTCQRLDSGYQGVKKDNKTKYIVLPEKKPKGKELSEVAKENNRAHSKRRVVAEHAFSRIKKFKICGNLYRGLIESYNQTFRNIVAIINFKLANPAVIM